MGILLGCKKENFTLCNSKDGPGEHYAKCNKPVKERQISYGFIHVECNDKVNSKAKQKQIHRWKAE